MLTSSVYVNPKWVQDAVANRAWSRTSLGALKSDYAEFMDKFNVNVVQFGPSDLTEVPGSEAVVDVTTKEYRNDCGKDDDEIEIIGQDNVCRTNFRSYQLKLGSEQSNQFIIGGSSGIATSFFNLGGPGIGLNGEAKSDNTFTTTNRREIHLDRNWREEKIGKGYSISGKIKIPAKTMLEVTLATYTVNFQVSHMQVQISAPASTGINVRLVRRCLCQSRFCFLTAEDFLKSLYPSRGAVKTVGGVVSAVGEAQLTYLGEKTKVTKKCTSLDCY